jgi:hypothetical protein
VRADVLAPPPGSPLPPPVTVPDVTGGLEVAVKDALRCAGLTFGQPLFAPGSPALTAVRPAVTSHNLKHCSNPRMVIDQIPRGSTFAPSGSTDAGVDQLVWNRVADAAERDGGVPVDPSGLAEHGGEPPARG